MESVSLEAEMDRKKNEEVSKLIEKNGGKLLNFIRKRVCNLEDAEDIYQDVVSQFFLSFDPLRPIEQISSWLFRVARNRIIDGGRKKSEELLDLGIFDELNPLLQRSSGSTVEDEYWRDSIMEAITEALIELPEPQRNVFVEHEFNGRSFNDISAEMGVSVNTLLSRKRYAVLHLRERLLEYYNEIE